MAKNKARTPGVDSARRALTVLMLFGGEKPWLTAEEIAQQAGVSVPSAYRFLSLLRELGLVEEHGVGTHALTPRVFALASSAEQAFDLGPALRPVLHDITKATGESALVIRRVGDHATCVELAETDHTVRLSFTPGQIMSLHRGAGPKLLLAATGVPWAERYLQRVGVSNTESAAVLAELRDIGTRGWSISSGEVDEGVWAAAAPVIIGGRTVAVLSVAGPRYRIDSEHEMEMLGTVIAHANAVSERFARDESVDVPGARDKSRGAER